MTDERKYTPDVRVYGMRSTHGDDQLHSINELPVMHLNLMDSGSPLPITLKRHMGPIVPRVFRGTLIGGGTPRIVLDDDFNHGCSALFRCGSVEISSGEKARIESRLQAKKSYLFEQPDAVTRSSTYREKEKIANRG